MAYDYRGKLVLLTGASSGVGWHLAKAYHGQGSQLALVARREDYLKQRAQSLPSGNGPVQAFPADLLEIDRIPLLSNEVTNRFGKSVDVLVHAAGISCYGEVERSPFEIIEQVTRLNYLAGVRLVQGVLEPMKKQGGGQVVWVGSASAFRGRPLSAAYTASKAAVRCFCEALRSEVSRFGVDVLLVMPGGLKTGFHEGQLNFSSDRRIRPLRSPSDPEPLARAIVKAGKLRHSLLVYGRGAEIQHRLSRWAPGLLDRLFQESLR